MYIFFPYKTPYLSEFHYNTPLPEVRRKFRENSGALYSIPAVLCLPKLRSNSAHPEFTPDVSSLAFLSGAVLYQNLSLASTTHRKMYRTPLILPLIPQPLNGDFDMALA